MASTTGCAKHVKDLAKGLTTVRMHPLRVLPSRAQLHPHFHLLDLLVHRHHGLVEQVLPVLHDCQVAAVGLDVPLRLQAAKVRVFNMLGDPTSCLIS